MLLGAFGLKRNTRYRHTLPGSANSKVIMLQSEEDDVERRSCVRDTIFSPPTPLHSYVILQKVT